MPHASLREVVAAWISREDIQGVREMPGDGGEHSVAFDYNIDDQIFEAFVDVCEEPGFLSVYIYAPLRVPAARINETIRLLNHRNGRLRVGSVEMVGERRAIRYRAAMPARPNALLPDDVDLLVQLGGDLFQGFFPQMMAVVFGGMTAAAALGMDEASEKPRALN